jgi:intracellular sulfur oxidation DsrE/DsrF family protein
MNAPKARRGFLGELAAAAVGLAAIPFAGARAATTTTAPVGGWDEKWLDALTAKHKQFFDAPDTKGGAGLVQARNFLNAFRDAYATTDRDVNVVVGFHGSAAPLAFKDAAWEKFRLAQYAEIIDPATKNPSLRNFYHAPRPSDPVPADAAIAALQQRGVVVLLCNNSLKRITRTLHGDGYGDDDALRAELLTTHLIPGVVLVPSMVVAANRTQARGFSYVYAG